jgi:Na+-transporting NADH:ubiquinone oxidoreductase subunit NqrC
MARSFNTIEIILIVALIVALLCSVVICYYVYVLKDHYYRDGFSSWQMPMIFAILADLYLIK